jgi:outer membrane protein OmpA-like peptidoglycan-associated protein
MVVLSLLLACSACAAQTGARSADEQKYLVFFQEWSAQLDTPAQGAITAAAAEAKAHPTEHVTVTGFADPTGSPQANVEISRLRAQVVSDALVSNGVDQARISRSARGATEFMANSLESRRVEIAVGP